MSHLKYNIYEVSLITFMILQSHVANFQALHSDLIWCRRPNQASMESNRLPKGSTKTDYAENFIRTKQKNSTNGGRGTPIAFLLMASSFICPQQWKKHFKLMYAAQTFTWLDYHKDIYSRHGAPWFHTDGVPLRHLPIFSEKWHSRLGAQKNLTVVLSSQLVTFYAWIIRSTSLTSN